MISKKSISEGDLITLKSIADNKGNHPWFVVMDVLFEETDFIEVRLNSSVSSKWITANIHDIKNIMPSGRMIDAIEFRDSYNESLRKEAEEKLNKRNQENRRLNDIEFILFSKTKKTVLLDIIIDEDSVQIDSITLNKIKPPYLRVYVNDGSTDTYYCFGRDTTPYKLHKEWFSFDAAKQRAIESIKKKMAKFLISKKEI